MRLKTLIRFTNLIEQSNNQGLKAMGHLLENSINMDWYLMASMDVWTK